MRLVLTTAIMILGLSAQGWAQPAISDISGTVEEGQAVSMVGVGFGSKVPAAPFIWDDFQSGVPGTDIQGWRTYAPANEIQYSNFSRFTGDVSIYQNFRDHYANALMVSPLPDFDKFYVTGWWYNQVGGAPSRNFKIINLSGGDSYGTATTPQNRSDVYPSQGSGHLYASNSDGDVTQGWELGSNIHSGEWMRLERFVDIPDGRSWIKRNLQMWADIDNADFYSTTDRYNLLLITHYFAKDTGTPTPWMDSYWGELYIDTTPARVELGNASTWDACTVREIQIPTAWASEQVSFTVHQGSFIPGQTAYLYVVNEDEEHNTDGFPVSIGSLVDPGPPTEPGTPTRNLRLP